MEILKKIACMLGLLLWAGGILVGLVLTVSAGSLVPVLSIVILGAMSFPTARKMIKYMES